MKAPQWVRLLVLAFAFMSVAGVLAVVACGPLAPPAPPNGAGGVSDSVSVPATEVPFVLPQLGGGDGAVELEMTSVDSVLPQQSGNEPTDEQTEALTPTPTATRYVPPTADRSLCHDLHALRSGTVVGTRCPPDGDPAVDYDLRRQYNAAMREIEAVEAEGKTGEFPTLPVYISTNTVEATDAVAELLRANGVQRMLVHRDSPDGEVGARMNIGLIPQVVAIDGVRHLREQSSTIPPETFDVNEMTLEGRLMGRFFSVVDANKRREARGEPTVEYSLVRVRVTAISSGFVDRVVEYLEANGAANLKVKKGESGAFGYAEGTVEADVPVMLLWDLAGISGIKRVEEVRPTSRVPVESSGRDSVELTPTPTPRPAVKTSQADQWHRAGFTGSGVEVAIIDVSFDGFVSRILPKLSAPVHFLCYDVLGKPKEGTLTAATAAQGGNPAGYFDACQTIPGSTSAAHGTHVVAALLEIAPDVKLYLSNPGDVIDRGQVIKWLADGDSDDALENAHYEVEDNNEFDVKVINHSASGEWEGSGDGNVGIPDQNRRTWLHMGDDAVSGGVLWVNAAGNSGEKTWFSRPPDFTDASPFFLEFNALGGEDNCVPFGIEVGEVNKLQTRWEDSWPRAATNLNLVLFDNSGDEPVPVIGADMFGGNDPQSGGVDHYPLEFLLITANALPAGEYCVGVQRVTGSNPEWVQLQMSSGSGLDFSSDDHSMESPAESDNSGMLSVGATTDGGDYVYAFSSKGPAPEPPNRAVLDLVAPGFSPIVTNLTGTSFAAPRVAGLAALVIQALGGREFFEEPSDFARYLKRFASRSMSCSHEWGCGFALLPPLDPPTNLRLESTSNACVRPGPVHNVVLRFDPPPGILLFGFRLYAVDLKKVGDPDTDVSSLRFSSSLSADRLPGGETYVAKGYTCTAGGAEGPICGVVSVPSNTLVVPRKVCTPGAFEVFSGDGSLTLRWNVEPDAVGYEVEREGFDPVFTTNQHLVVEGLTNRELYRFRILSKGPSGTSAWSDWVRKSPSSISSPSLPEIGRVILQGGDVFRQNDATFSWAFDLKRSLHEVRVREAGSSTWSVLPFQPVGWDEVYRVVFDYSPPEYSLSDVQAHLRGLMPGMEYEMQVRGVNGDKVSPWTETVSFTTLGRRPAEGADRPSVPAGLQVMVNAVQPFPRVVLGWDAAAEDYLHEVRIMGGGLATWGRLPYQPIGWSSEYSVLYPTDGQAFITGLIPDTEYRFAVRAARERDSSSDLDHSSWSNVVSLTTPGVRPATAPGAATAPPLKAPAKDLMAVVDGTTVDLSWTVATNPNYVRQVVFRRVSGVSPIQWTEIPVDLNDATYSDTGLTSGITYRYRVRSYKQMVGGNYGESGHAEAVIP